ncbi:MAG: GAF domain-containing protein [Planctomycetia bacterium]|nr:GAF domain-containing protein [Planctomycetia bacterium]
MPRLIVIKGVDEGKQFELTGAVFAVGRDAASGLRLHDTEVSRRHAEFRLMDGGYHVLDVGSANGTFVNNQPVKDALLRSGDHVQIGQTILVFSAGKPASQGPSDLADRISMITRQDIDFSSAIVKTIAETEGHRILSRPEQAQGTAWLKTALANLGVMYETIQATSYILDVDQLLERIMELIFRSIGADRGCIMLRTPDTTNYEPKAIRFREKVDHQEKIPVSRTIMDYVLKEKQGVLTADAGSDQRFNTGQSIVRFGIHEVICVPMKGRHETVGVLYMDTHSTARDLIQRSMPSRFSEDHLTLAMAIGHQAALAVEETRYHQAMLQAERLAAIGQTIAALSHHIKNILQGLRSGREILKMGLTEKNDQLLQQGWKIVEKNQGRMEHLVMDMLSYSKEREPAFEETDLNQIVKEVVELMKGRAKDGNASLEMRLEVTLPPVPAESEAIHRALLNIVTNAIDAVEERNPGQVIVSTNVEADGAWARISVTDNGTGIPLNKVAEIFKPFVSTKGAKGTGLGLAVSRKVLREHGGDILVQSQPGKGTRMILRLPMKGPPGYDPGTTLNDAPPSRPKL